MVFQASTVEFNKKPVGCAAWPLFPMMTCGNPLALPTANVIPLNYLHRTFVGLSFSDTVSGVVKIVISVVIDYVFHRLALSDAAGAAAAPAAEVVERTTREAAEHLARQIGGEILGNLVPTSMRALDKLAVNALAGFGESVFNEWLHPSDNTPSMKIPIINGVLELNIGGQPDQGPDNAPVGAGELGRRHAGDQRVTADSPVGSYGDPLNIFGD